ncbi:MAG: lipoprotein [Ottowia sp.]|nr:lipoprotein [Ottowia sp.]
MIATPQPRLILASAAAVLAAALSGCGQTGALYLPQAPEGVQRATLPQAIFGYGEGVSAPQDAASAPLPTLSDEDFDDITSVPILP